MGGARRRACAVATHRHRPLGGEIHYRVDERRDALTLNGSMPRLRPAAGRCAIRCNGSGTSGFGNPGSAVLARDAISEDVSDQVGANPRVAFFSPFSARFSFSVFAGFFFVSFFLSRPLAITCTPRVVATAGSMP